MVTTVSEPAPRLLYHAFTADSDGHDVPAVAHCPAHRATHVRHDAAGGQDGALLTRRSSVPARCCCRAGV